MSTICTEVLNTNTVFVISRSGRAQNSEKRQLACGHKCFITSFNFSESVDSQLDSCHSCDQYLDKTPWIIGNRKITCPLDICRVRLPDCASRDRAQNILNILILTAKTVYIQLHLLLIFRYFISYNIFFFRDKMKKII